MAQQRVHDITLKSLKSLTASINESRVKIGEKKMTAPDVLHEAVQFLYIEHLKAKKKEMKND